MSVHDVDGMNVGYARGLFEEYLENPDAVPAEWRAVFESGDPDLLQSLPGLARLLETLRADGDGVTPLAPAPPAQEPAPPSEPAPAPPPEAVDQELLGAVAAAASLIKAHRTHGHLAAHLDPLGSEPVGDPAPEPELLVPKLTPRTASAHPGVRPTGGHRGRDAGRRPPAPTRDLLRDDRLRDRAHLRPSGARLVAAGNQVGVGTGRR